MGEKESASQFASDGDLPDGSDEPIPGKPSKEQRMSQSAGGAEDPPPPSTDTAIIKSKSNITNN